MGALSGSAETSRKNSSQEPYSRITRSYDVEEIGIVGSPDQTECRRVVIVRQTSESEKDFLLEDRDDFCRKNLKARVDKTRSQFPPVPTLVFSREVSASPVPWTSSPRERHNGKSGRSAGRVTWAQTQVRLSSMSCVSSGPVDKSDSSQDFMT